MKLKLKLDDLQVKTFETTAVPTEKGTVFGEQCTCPGAATCDASCNGTCEETIAGPTCNVSCGYSCVDYTPCNEFTQAGTCYDTCNCTTGPRTFYC
jgi:hypothetical protein